MQFWGLGKLMSVRLGLLIVTAQLINEKKKRFEFWSASLETPDILPCCVFSYFDLIFYSILNILVL